MNNKNIPLSIPNFIGNERKYVDSAVMAKWVSTGGEYVDMFENSIAKYVDMPRAVATASGTAAIHLGLIAAGVGINDEVIVPALTFVAAINPVMYVNAQPVFVDCDDYLCMSPKSILEFLENSCELINGKTINKKTNKHVKAIIPVHVFGNICAMEEIMDIADKYKLIVIEDATEALGSYHLSGRYKGKYAGTIGDIGCYSFNGNKIITTGGGGMLVSNNPDWTKRAKHLSTQAKIDEVKFFHDEVGYNYRMTNLQGALGVAQMEELEGFIKIKHESYDYYFNTLHNKNGMKILPFREDTRSNKWFYSVFLDSCNISRDEIMEKMTKNMIQTRPIWALISDLAPYKKCQTTDLTMSKKYIQNVVNIPCSTDITPEQRQIVADTLLTITK